MYVIFKCKNDRFSSSSKICFCKYVWMREHQGIHARIKVLTINFFLEGKNIKYSYIFATNCFLYKKNKTRTRVFVIYLESTSDNHGDLHLILCCVDCQSFITFALISLIRFAFAKCSPYMTIKFVSSRDIQTLNNATWTRTI